MNRGPSIRPTWLHYNLFRTRAMPCLTVVFGSLAIWLLYKTIIFIFVTGRWTIIEVNLRLLMIGRYPEVHVAAARCHRGGARRPGVDCSPDSCGAARFRAGRVDRDDSKRLRPGSSTWSTDSGSLARVILLILVLVGTSGPWIIVGLAIVAAIVGRLIGPFLGRSA